MSFGFTGTKSGPSGDISSVWSSDVDPVHALKASVNKRAKERLRKHFMVKGAIGL